MAQTQVFRGTARRIVETENSKIFYYHATPIAELQDTGKVALNSGGWRTATTKTAMNQVANQYCNSRWYVFQKNRDWYVKIDGDVIPFYDGMVL